RGDVVNERPAGADSRQFRAECERPAGSAALFAANGAQAGDDAGDRPVLPRRRRAGAARDGGGVDHQGPARAVQAGVMVSPLAASHVLSRKRRNRYFFTVSGTGGALTLWSRPLCFALPLTVIGNAPTAAL